MAYRCQSSLVLRGRPLRLPRKLSEADRVTLLQFAHRIRDVQREVARHQNLSSDMISTWLQLGTNGTMIRDLQQLYRDLALAIQGLRAREVPGFDADAKQQLIKLVNKIAEEYQDVIHLRVMVAALAAELQHLTREVSQLRVRSFGEHL